MDCLRSLKLTPTKKVPETMAELFKGWHGKYETPTDLQDWDKQVKSYGKDE